MTPQEGGRLRLYIEVADTEFNGVEFTLKDTSNNNW